MRDWYEKEKKTRAWFLELSISAIKLLRRLFRETKFLELIVLGCISIYVTSIVEDFLSWRMLCGCKEYKQKFAILKETLHR
mmetsp:Transcript_7220/g.9145  ORF Transcript_7220/g.9145 Transcript_7220/m.9145 type:complete len:81 (+) Transcript_7220:359-601(+)